MYHSSVRSATGDTGKTVLALLAVLSLVLSLFAITQPAIANHVPPDGPEVIPTAEEFPGGNPICPAGSVGIRFNNPAATQFQTVTLADGSTATVTIVSVAGNLLTFTVDGGLAAIVKVKGGVSSPGTNDQNVYDYRGLPGGGIAHDDGLKNPGQQGISHVDFCLVPIEGSIIVYKTDQLQADVPGAEFTVKDGDTVVGGPTDTDANGLVCFDGLVVGKTYSVIETDAPDGWLPADPDTQSVVAVQGSCEDRAGDDPDATFTNTRVGSLIVLKTDDNATTPTALPGAEFTVDGVTQTTDANGLTCFDGLVAGDPYDVTETTPPPGYEPADPATQEDIIAGSGTCADRAQDEPDVTFTNMLTPGSLIVLKTDDQEPATALPGAEFTVDGVTQTTDANGLTCFDGLVAGDPYDVTETTPPPGYEPADPATQEDIIAGSGTCADRAQDEPDVTFTNEKTEDTGSITVVKEIECEECETRTIGYYFNTADQHEEETNALFADLGGIMADGILFTNVDQVQQYRADDQDGTSDGQNGLSATGQLTLQYLGAVLNVARNGEDCDLASRIYNNPDSPLDGMTVQEILDEAVKAFDGDDTNDTFAIEDIKSALDDINNSSHEDENPLSCEGSESGTLDGVKFDLFLEADYPEGDPIDSGTTGDDGPGTVIFDGLALDETYVLVESGFPEGLTCEIVDVKGEGFTFTLNDDGSVTIELTAEVPDVTLTVVNDCEEDEEEEEFGEIEIRKSAADDPEESFAFSASWDADGFTLMDGDAEFSGDLPAGEEFTVTEELTEEQILAGWTLADINCGDAPVEIDGNSVTITVVADAIITCTFTNELEEDENGELEVIKIFCPTEGEDSIHVFGPLDEEPVEFGVQGIDEEEELPSDEGCTLGAPSEEALGATFTITGGDLAEPLVVITTWDEILTLELAPGDYTIVEEGTGLTADFTIEVDQDTAVVVFNFEEEEEEEGRLKILKFYCVGEGDPVFTVVEDDATIGDVTLPDNCESPEPGDATFTLTMGETTSGEFTLGSDGARLIPVAAGTYSLNEVDPNEASSAEFDVTAGGTTTVIVFNFDDEGEQPGGGGPGQGETPREGTQGGNPVPDTALLPTPTGSLPAALLALLMLAGLGTAGYAVRAEARRRR